jgi:hypothetical protein
MNERIKELAREAGLLVHNPEGVLTKLDKFAELIIQECMNSLDEQYLYIADDADFSDNKIWISAIMNKTVDGCKRRIQTNFEGCGSMKPGGRSESYSDIMTFLSSVL